MNETALARAVAADLGDDVLAAVEERPSPEATRAFGVTEAVAIGGFLLACARTVVDIWRARQDRALLVLQLSEKNETGELAQVAPHLDPEKRLSLMARVLKRFLPEDFGLPANHPDPAKRKWVQDYLASRGEADKAATRDFTGGPPILIPFAAQDLWILGQPIGWIPDDSDGPGVIRVDVPRGFVTDLASVPRILWPVLAHTGRYGNAAIYHDWLYVDQPCTREVADRVFDRAMVDMGVDAPTRNIIWAAVRVFGGDGWERCRRDKAAGVKYVLKRFPDDPRIIWEEWRQKPDVFA